MKPINFIAPNTNLEVYSLLVHCSASGFKYDQTVERVAELGFYIPEDQYKIFDDILNIQIDLDIGDRQDEYKR